jgi:predicted acetyltransferase
MGSARFIDKNGGVHQDTIDNVIDGNLLRTRRYWVETAVSI